MPKETEDQKTEPEVTENEETKSPEDLAVEEAEAAVAAEEAEPDDKPKEDENAEFEEVTDGAVEEKTDKPKEEAEPRAVPIAALHDTRNKLEEANLRVARLEGELAATRKPADESQDPEPTPQERVGAIREQKVANAKKFDDGDIDAVQMERARQELEDAERAIHEETNRASAAPSAAQLDATIEQNLVRLAGEYPVISAVGRDEMKGFVEQAFKQAETDGKPFGPGALETIRLHNEAAAIAHNHYARFFKSPAAPDGEKTGDQPQELEGLSDKAKARSDKLDVAANHPPNINQIGSAAEGTLSDEQINSKMEGMSESERIEFLEQMPGLAKRLTGVG